MRKAQKRDVIDERFFTNYAGRRKSYRMVWRDHAYVDECVELFEKPEAPRIRKVCVLGAATGEILREFHRAFKTRPFGCEISEWAYSKIALNYRRKIKRADMIDYVDAQVAKDRVFDLA